MESRNFQRQNGQSASRPNQVVVYKDGKPATSSNVLVKEEVESHITIKTHDGTEIDAPDSIKNDIRSSEAPDPVPAYRNGVPLMDLQGLNAADQRTYDFYNRVGLKSVDTVKFTILVNNIEQGSRTIISTKTVSSVNISVKPYELKK